MLSIVLFEPEIPPNAGNIIRLCANTGAALHFVHPLGFELDDRRLRRAGLDYHEFADVQQHADWDALCEALPGRRMLAFTTRGETSLHDLQFQSNDVLLFGPETRGLPAERLADFSAGQRVRIPMRDNSRSLNLSNAVAVALYEGWRQLGFPDGA